jgi:hypothetical protein
MLTRKFFFGLAALALVSTGTLAGCAVDSTNAEDEETESADGELSAAGKALIGAYEDDSGSFRGLILTANKKGQRNEFIAQVSTGIVCITTPCPSAEHIEGTFTAGTKTITLYSTTASNHSKHLLGKYSYLKQGDKLTLFRKNFSQSLAKVPSYCSQPSDCSEQALIHPMCVGGWTCSTENRCGWKCGVPVDACNGLTLSQCTANPACQPKFGPSACSPSGICTADMAYKGCFKKEPPPPPPPPTGEPCGSVTCGEGLVCCNSSCGICTAPGMFCIQIACGPNQ